MNEYETIRNFTSLYTTTNGVVKICVIYFSWVFIISSSIVIIYIIIIDIIIVVVIVGVLFVLLLLFGVTIFFIIVIQLRPDDAVLAGRPSAATVVCRDLQGARRYRL